ncbi:hypothetical protein [Actinoplanes sp. NBRC 101535]|uniref:hypothetical protein n=1 Tax=Actinoplanes sp. NBRC 101535 TaxID=3032196 RepID=UPI0024A408E0|nr:hypothetical protein [Actinoplanes sp. NBRC 101535]GLY08253.1 hypothetical protein Acsp01_86320 [Actinoplanes sp. NBRC 101535]
MALVNIAGLTTTLQHTLTVTAARTALVSPARLGVLTGHAPGRADGEIGVLCWPCSPDRSRVAWPCMGYRKAAAGLVTGLLG